MNIIESIQASIFAAGVSPNTEKAYWYAGHNFFLPYIAEQFSVVPDDMLSLLTPQMFIGFPGWLNSKQIGKTSKQLIMSGVTNYFQWLVENAHLTPDTTQMQKYYSARKRVSRLHESPMIQVPKESDADEIIALAAANPRQIMAKRDVALLNFARYTGCRVQEISDMLVGDIDLSTVPYKVHVKSGKGRKERYTYANEEVKKSLLEYWSMRPDLKPTDYAFLRHNNKDEGQPIEPGGIRWMIRNLCSKLNFTLTPHSFRHLFITEVVRKKDIVVAQSLAGHADIATTKRYTQLADEEIREAYGDTFKDGN